MLEKLISVFERIAIALETLASAPVTGLPPRVPPAQAAGAIGTLDTPATPEEKAQAAAAATLTKAVQEQKQTANTTATQPDRTGEEKITREQVGTALIALATGKGREVAVATLAQFDGAAKLDQVKEADYVNLLGAIAKAAA